ncbi:MAG: alpha/beta hydrolase [Propionibacteriaceae bacterium]|jgi:3-oxoadipate enol-lactonase|nr:alpha/beta hydrolase [Propionibacteriaceae bacterium]
MPTARLGGFSIAYETYGNPANPPVCLVHGIYHDHLSMATLAERLSDAYFVISPDAIGHGRSEKPDRYTLLDQGRVIVCLIEKLAGGPAAVLGEAWGAVVAAQAACLNPGLVSALILIAPLTHGEGYSIATRLQAEGFDPAALNLDERWRRLDADLWSPETPLDRRAAIQADRAPAVLLGKAEMAAADAALTGFDLRGELSKITARTLVLTGRYDRLNPPKSGHETASFIPGARFELFERSGHLLKEEEQVQLGDVIRQFLGR